MPYKTILVHVNGSSDLDARLDMAFRIAETENAHVIGAAASGISRLIFQGGDGTDIGMAECMNTMLDIARKEANDSLARFEGLARSSACSFERKLVEDEPYAGLTGLSQTSDLVVVGQADRDDPASASVLNLPEYIALGAGRPVLVVPCHGNFPTLGERVVIAWNASISAVHAVTGSMPFLKRATHIDLVVFNPEPKQGSALEQSCSDLARNLARHGIEANILINETGNDIGSALIETAEEQRADLLVMGCYGHTRFREILLGGATRTMLEKMTIPVLMSH